MKFILIIMYRKNLICLILFLLSVFILSKKKINSKKKTSKIDKNRNKEKIIIPVLNDTTYDRFLTENNNVLLMFESVKCKPCKSLNRILKKMAYEIKSKNWDIKVARIDGILNPTISEKFNIHKEGYPSMYLINHRENSTSEYNGDLSFPGVFSYLKYRMNYNVKEISSLSEIIPLVKKRHHVILFAGDKNRHLNQFNSITKNYDELRHHLVLYTKNSEILHNFNIPSDSFDVILFNVLGHPDEDNDKNDKKVKIAKDKKHSNLTIDYGIKMNLGSSTNLTKEMFVNNLYSYMRPLVDHLSDLTLNTVFDERVTTLIIISKDDKEIIPLAERIAPKYRPGIWFLIGNYYDESNHLFIKNLNISKSDLPAMVLFNHDRNMVDDIFKYKWESQNKKIESEDIENFINDWRNKKLKRFWISEEKPKKKTNRAGVHNIVSDNLFKYLGNFENDLLILFCTHFSRRCNHFEKLFNILSLKLRNNTNLIIGKIDPTANEFEGIEFKEVPHLMFLSGGDNIENRLKNSAVYSGNYTLSDLVKFVENNSKNKLEIAHIGKKEDKYLKSEPNNPIIKERDEEFDIHSYTGYGKQRFIGDYEKVQESEEHMNEEEEEDDHEGDEEGHPNEDEHPYDHEEDDEYAKRDL